MSRRFGLRCVAVRDLGLARASDRAIFGAARIAAKVVVTKDRDFAELAARLGPPPAIILLTIGNTSTRDLADVFDRTLPTALDLVEAGESLIEIGG